MRVNADMLSRFFAFLFNLMTVGIQLSLGSMSLLGDTPETLGSEADALDMRDREQTLAKKVDLIGL